jgi:hypothetical protein
MLKGYNKSTLLINGGICLWLIRLVMIASCAELVLQSALLALSAKATASMLSTQILASAAALAQALAL